MKTNENAIKNMQAFRKTTLNGVAKELELMAELCKAYSASPTPRARNFLKMLKHSCKILKIVFREEDLILKLKKDAK